MAKPELGTKRLCGSCGAKFYDLSKSPIVCPKCGTTFEVVAPAPPRGRGGEAMAAAAAAAATAPSQETKSEVPETADVELVSLEEADAETEGKKALAEGDDDDIEIEDTEEAPFIEEEEEGADDVSDIIGEGREDDEET